MSIYKIARQDDQYLYVKQYIVGTVAPMAAAAPALVPDAAPALPLTRRFQLLEFDRGLPRTGQWRDDFAIADMNGDGNLDIVSGPARKSLSGPAIFLGDGQGSWTRWAGTKFPSLPYDYGAVAVADFNGDGIADIALAMHLRGITVLTGNGKGEFTRFDDGLPLGAPGAAQDATFSSHAITTIDWDGDGKPDLVALDEGLLGSSKYLLSSAAQAGMKRLSQSGGRWTRADSAAERNQDLAGSLTEGVANRVRRVVAVPRLGGEGAAVAESAGAAWSLRAIRTLPAGAIVRASAAADLDGNGQIDLVLSYQIYQGGDWRSAIDAFYAMGDGYVRRPIYRENSQVMICGALGLGHLESSASWDLVAACRWHLNDLWRGWPRLFHPRSGATGAGVAGWVRGHGSAPARSGRRRRR